jgi:TolB-like protein/DNA-binding SARP family transcriptional activator/Flp pilus assembly protein TadD
MLNVMDTPSSTRGSCLRLTLLGGVLIEIEQPDGIRNELRFTARKARAMLAYLAVAPRQRAAREKLANLMWGDRVPDQQARQSLRQSLVVLRQELAPVGFDPFIIEADDIALRPGILSTDVNEFVTLAKSQRIEDLERACALYRGDFLADFSVDAEGFEEWQRGERARLEELAAHALAEASNAWDAAGDARAVDAALRLAQLDPLREDWQRTLLQRLVRFRGRDAALAQATSFATLLERDLGTPPSAATQALIDEIRRGALAPQEGTPALEAVRPAAEAGAPSLREGGTAAQETSPATAPAPSALTRPRFAIAAAAIISLVAATALAGIWLRPAAPVVQGPTAVAPDPTWQSPSALNDVEANERALSATGIYPVVVLPFSTDAAPGTPEAKIAAQITDDLINDLSRTPSVRVISRQTSNLYRGRAVDVAAIGVELGVRYVIDGSLRRQDGTLRINVALIDTRTRLQIWSDRFESPESERFDIQEQMTRGLARQLHVTVTLANRGSARVDPALNELLASAWSGVFRSVSVGHTGDSESRFQEILRRKPDMVPALVGVAATHLALLSNMLVFDREERLAAADAALKKAVARNPNSSVAHYFLGILQKMRGDFQGAHASFLKTLELNPSHAPAYAHLGHTLMLLGRADEALEPIHYAMRLSPKDPLLGYWHVLAAEVDMELGDDRSALERLMQAVKVSPGNPRMHVFLASQCAIVGKQDCTARHVAEARKLSPQLTTEKLLQQYTGRARTAGGARFLNGMRRAFGGT